MGKARKEIWLYERVANVTGELGKHLYVVLSDEHPAGEDGMLMAEFVETVYTSPNLWGWKKVGQAEAYNKVMEGKYTYVNYSYRALMQEWERPVFACRKASQDNPNFFWDCFKKQLLRATRSKYRG